MTQALTFTELKARTARLLQDTGFIRWSEDEQEDFINDALVDLATRAPMLWGNVVLEPYASTAQDDAAHGTYCVPAAVSMVTFKRVRNAGKTLDRTTFDAECDRSDTWESEEGTPDRFFHGEYGPGVFRMIPAPDDELDDVRVMLARLAALLTSGAHVPEVPVLYHRKLPYGAVAMAYLRDGEAMNLPNVQTYLGIWEATVAQARLDVSNKYDRGPRVVVREAI